MKGIILAGGSGTRLYPITMGVSKQLLPVYDKPMIYYPLSVLMLAGIRDILIITTENDLSSFKRLLGNGNNIGINIEFKVQKEPKGLAQAFIIGEEFIGESNVCMVLGDNIFYGSTFTPKLKANIDKIKENKGATLFAYEVNDPERFGVVEFDKNNKVLSIEEKPNKPKSNFAATGLYFYDNSVIKKAKALTPSDRGELEITCLNKLYLDDEALNVELLGRGFAWLDTGTHESMIEASQFVHTIEKRQGFKIACIEEIAFKNKWIDSDQLKRISKKYSKNCYGEYLNKVLEL